MSLAVELKKLSQGYPIFIYPNIAYKELVKLYGKSSIYWHAAGFEETDPTKMEHFGISTVEAMAAGCVAVVVNKGGQTEIVENGVSGFLWNTLDELLEYTLSTIRDRGLMDKMMKESQKRSNLFSKRIFTQQIEEIVQKHKGLVYAAVNAMQYHMPNTLRGNTDRDDLFQIAVIGLIKAARVYDPTIGVKFSNYAYDIMINQIRSYYARGFTKKRKAKVISLNRPLKREESRERVLSDEIADPHAVTKAVPSKEEVMEIIKAANLTERERDIILLRFGLSTPGNKIATLDEIGKKYGVTREGIRLIQVKVLQKLARNKAFKRLWEELSD